MKILIDNGHGSDTAGKRSPDGALREYAYTREIARRIVCRLMAEGVDAELLTPEQIDVPLKERVKRVNDKCRAYGSANVLLVSVHNNAAGDGSQWMKANGWSAHVSLNASQASKCLAQSLIKAAGVRGLRVRTYAAHAPYWPQNLAICRDSYCPAVLTENLFQDNREDVAYLLTEEGKEAITRIHVDGILSYLKESIR